MPMERSLTTSQQAADSLTRLHRIGAKVALWRHELQKIDPRRRPTAEAFAEVRSTGLEMADSIKEFVAVTTTVLERSLAEPAPEESKTWGKSVDTLSEPESSEPEGPLLLPLHPRSAHSNKARANEAPVVKSWWLTLR